MKKNVLVSLVLAATLAVSALTGCGAGAADSAADKTIKVGATGNVGLMGWNIWFQVDTGANDAGDSTVAFSVPFELTVSF